MVALARGVVPDAEAVEVLVLPDDPIPEADAVVSVGHVLCYLADEHAVDRGLRAAARAVAPGGLLALDLCDLEWGRARRDAPPFVAVEDDWAIVTRFSVPRPDRFVRDITTFVRDDDGRWRRDDERHVNVLLDTTDVPGRLAEEGVAADVLPGFDGAPITVGLVAVVGRRPG
jgi:SAM-dependent methyltransferase